MFIAKTAGLPGDLESLTITPLDTLLQRLSISSAGEIAVDRALYRETRTLSGVVVHLEGYAYGRDLLYEARRLRLTEESPSETFSRVVAEGEAVRLLLKEPADVRKALFQCVNRALLCRFVADMLRLVEENGAIRLETALYMPMDVLKLVIRHEGQEVVLGE